MKNINNSLVYKDDILLTLYNLGFNIAQFISLDNKGELRRQLLKSGQTELNVKRAIEVLLKNSFSGTVNVRSYHPESSQGCPFVYGLSTVDDVMATIEKRINEGLYTIINETIDVADGGISGVAEGGIIEIAPGTTPRGVESMDVVPLPFNIAKILIETIYSIYLCIPINDSLRIEFSVHPTKCGVRAENTIVWEIQKTDREINGNLSWPNPLSRHIGDKVFGLLIANILGLSIPRTQVYLRDRRIESFTFGVPTESINKWTRTCPAIQMPGKFQTINKYVDPFELMNDDDLYGEFIPSCIVQDEVIAIYSGATITGADNKPITNGVAGFGDLYMIGEIVENLPDYILSLVEITWIEIFNKLGPCRFEWVYDGKKIWILQLHKDSSLSIGNVIVPGEPKKWIEYNSSMHLETLREIILNNNDFGIKITSPIGMTSHVADILRKNNIPSYINK